VTDSPPDLNPALRDLGFCPRCGAPDPSVEFPRSITCAGCGYAAYYNPKPVACAIPTTEDGRVWLMRRATDPGRGRWSMPGGFVDLGESVEEAARREVGEEMAIEVELTGLVGVYSSPRDRTVVIAYAARTNHEPRTTEEALEVRSFAPMEIPWADLALSSDELALRDILGREAREAVAARARDAAPSPRS
jgi:8-oxo-dGTP diphosphatase